LITMCKYSKIIYKKVSLWEWGNEMSRVLWKWVAACFLAVVLSGYGAGAEGTESVLDLPDSLHTISDEAFAGLKDVERVELPDSLTTIGSRTFADSSIVSITLHAGLREIADDAFDGCGELTALVYPGTYAQKYCQANGIQYEVYKTPVEDFVYTTPNAIEAKITGYNGSDAFVVIPDEIDGYPVTQIGSSVFANSKTLKGVYIPSSVETIENNVFSGCKALTDVCLSEGLKSIGNNVFKNCTALTEMTIPEGVISIGDSVFAYCSELTQAALPDSLEKLGSYVFENCVKLTAFDYPKNWTNMSLVGGLLKGCELITEITVPDGIEFMPENAFYRCDYIEKVNLPDSLMEIPANAFEECTRLTTINIPESVEAIRNDAFAKCVSLETLELPEGYLETIGNNVFKECTALTEMTIPEGVISIGDSVFAYCSKLTKVDLPDTLETLGSYVFENCVKLTAFDYPKNWTSMSWIGGLLKGCKLVTEITVPDGVEFLPNNAFYKCDYVRTVNLPDTLKEIPERAFADCAALRTINIPGSVGKIGQNAFVNCSMLRELYVPVSVTIIEGTPFSGCTRLTIESEYGSAAIKHAIDNDIKYYYLSLTGSRTPSGSVYIGDGFSLLGHVRSSVNVTEVVATLYSEDRSQVLQQVTVEPKVKDYNLQSGVSGAIDFSKLELGTYVFTLSASTSKSTETFVNRSFKIVPQPLRVYLREFKTFSGVNQAGTEQKLTGTVSANYPIDRLEIHIVCINDASRGQVIVKTPGTKTYDLAKANVNLADLSADSYSILIYVEGNGESKVLGKGSFEISSVTIPDGMDVQYEELLAFIDKDGNGRLFNGIQADYTLTIEENMTALEKINFSLATGSDYANATLKNAALELADREMHLTHQYYVDLYMKEICSFIADMENLNEVQHNTELGVAISKTITDCGSVSVESIQTLGVVMTEYEKLFVEALGDSLDTLGTGFEIMEFGSELAEVIQGLFVDYSKGMYVLDSLTNEARYGNRNYQEAVSVLKARFHSEAVRATEEIFDFVGDKLIEMGTEAVVDAFLTAVGGPYYIGFKIISLANTILDEIFDIYGDSNDYLAYTAMCETFKNARSAYGTHFEQLQANPGDESLLAQLIGDFEVTRRAAMRALQALLDMKHYKGIDYDTVRSQLTKVEKMRLPFMIEQ